MSQYRVQFGVVTPNWKQFGVPIWGITPYWNGIPYIGSSQYRVFQFGAANPIWGATPYWHPIVENVQYRVKRTIWGDTPYWNGEIFPIWGVTPYLQFHPVLDILQNRVSL